MKVTIKFLTLSCIVLALCFTSCSKDGNDGSNGSNGSNGSDGIDGVQGIAGQDGAAGTDGADGTDGTNGTDGNANVLSYVFDISNESGESISVDVPGFENDEVVKGHDAILFYLDYGSPYLVAIPGIVTSIYEARVSISIVDVNLRFYDTKTGENYDLPQGTLEKLHIVVIKNPTSLNKSLSSPLEELSAAGVDVKDYNAVMQYYGLN